MPIKTIDRVPSLIKSLNKLSETRVMVGIPAEKGTRDEGPLNNAAIGYIQENGAPEANIPARPFLVPGVKDSQNDYLPRLKTAGEAAFDGEFDRMDRNLNAAGLIASGAVKAKINEGVPPPLAESTIEARRRRGRTGTKPLIDTGQLRNAVTYVLRQIGGKKVK